MKMMMVQLTILCWFLSVSFLTTNAYPVESKPLNNNPDSWDLGTNNWMLYSTQNDSSDPSALALIGSDPHVKKSKITPKSIFIAPNAYNAPVHVQCSMGYRIDDNGKCIETVTINQDKILAARISELFGVDNNPNPNSDNDSDYYDSDDESKSEKDSGPLQVILPLAIDIEEEDNGKKIEYVFEEKLVITMRNLNPNDVATTTNKPEDISTTVSFTEKPDSISTEEPLASTTYTTEIVEESTMTTEATITSTEIEELTTLLPTTVKTTNAPITTTTALPSTTKIFSVDFLPKSQRKSNRISQASAGLKNSPDRIRKQKTTTISTKPNEKLTQTKLYKLDKGQVPKKNRTRNGSKRTSLRKVTTTTEINTESPVKASTQKPFWWLPAGWSIDETKEKPVLVRFWAQQPLLNERARSHDSRQRMNSRMPTDTIFREINVPELEKAN